jgi:hypothetical protein
MKYTCAHCSSRLVSKRYRLGTLSFCSKSCRLKWQRKLRQFEKAESKWVAYLARGSP